MDEQGFEPWASDSTSCLKAAKSARYQLRHSPVCVIHVGFRGWVVKTRQCGARTGGVVWRCVRVVVFPCGAKRLDTEGLWSCVVVIDGRLCEWRGGGDVMRTPETGTQTRTGPRRHVPPPAPHHTPLPQSTLCMVQLPRVSTTYLLIVSACLLAFSASAY